MEPSGLPRLPDAPKYPCPYLNDEEISTYLVPLYARGWSIGSSDYDRDSQLPPSDNVAPELLKDFLFSSSTSVAREGFISKVRKLQDIENHHGMITIIDDCVHIRTHTHTARPLSGPNAIVKRKRRPGITLRDVRLAILAEEAYRECLEQFSTEEKDSAVKRQGSRARGLSAQPLSTDEIERLRYAHVQETSTRHSRA